MYQLSECCSKGCLCKYMCKYYAFGRPSRMITSFTRITTTALACCTAPGPAQKSGKGPGVTCPYVLCQQSSFGVEESRSSIANYNIP